MTGIPASYVRLRFTAMPGRERSQGAARAGQRPRRGGARNVGVVGVSDERDRVRNLRHVCKPGRPRGLSCGGAWPGDSAGRARPSLRAVRGSAQAHPGPKHGGLGIGHEFHGASLASRPECAFDDLCRLSRHRGSCRRPTRTKARSRHRTSRVTAASVMCAAAPSLVALILARAVQAIGAAMIACGPRSVRARRVRGRRSGGLLVAISWRRILLMNIRLGCSPSPRACGCCPRSRGRATRCPKHFRP